MCFLASGKRCNCERQNSEFCSKLASVLGLSVSKWNVWAAEGRGELVISMPYSGRSIIYRSVRYNNKNTVAPRFRFVVTQVSLFTYLFTYLFFCHLDVLRCAVGAGSSASDRHRRRSHQSGMGCAPVWRRICDHRLHRRDLPQRQHHRLDDSHPRRRQLCVSRVDRSVGERPVLRPGLLREPGRPLQEAVWTHWADIGKETTSWVSIDQSLAFLVI